VENLWKFNDMGFDLVCISGGKAMRGPQSAGILMGKKSLIAAARLSAPPRSGIGRGQKVNKEEILGMYVALEKYVTHDHAAEWKLWSEKINYIDTALKGIKGVNTEIVIPPIANHTHSLQISWDEKQVKLSRDSLGGKLRTGKPSIEVIAWETENSIRLTVFMLKPGQEKIVAKRIREELLLASS
jgi:seryl-tRNA(Sec) selenium transferase